MKIPHIWSLALPLLLWTSSVEGTVDCTKETAGTQADIVFLIDISSSMCQFTDAMSATLNRFVSGLTAAKVDVKYAVATIAGYPAIAQPFTSDATMTKNTLNRVGCDGSGWEPNLEAVRVLLAPNYGADFSKSCSLYGTGSPCNIIWRSTAKKIVILVTDEDSDLPIKEAYRVGGQSKGTALCTNHAVWDANKKAWVCTNTIEPNFTPKVFYPDSTGLQANWFRSGMPLQLNSDWVDEIKLTASMLLKNKVFMNMLVNPKLARGGTGPKSSFNAMNRWWWDKYGGADGSPSDTVNTIMAQFGHPEAQVATNTSANGFNSAATLKNLNDMKLQDSLQARMLTAGGLSRIFNIQALLTSSTDSLGRLYSEQIYDTLLQQVVKCQQVDYSTSNLPAPTVTSAAPPPASVTSHASSYISYWENMKVTTTTTTSTTQKKTTTTSTTTKTTTKTTTTATTTTTPTTTTTTTSTTTSTTSTTTSSSTTTTPTTTTSSTTTSSTTTTSTATTTSSSTTTSTSTTSSTTTTPTTTTTSTTTTATTTTTTSTSTSTTSSTTSTTTTTSSSTTTSTSTTTTDTLAAVTTIPPGTVTSDGAVSSTTPSTRLTTTSTSTTTTTLTTTTSSIMTSTTTSTTTQTTTTTTTTTDTTTTSTTTTTDITTTTSTTTIDTTTTTSTTTTDTTTTTSTTTTDTTTTTSTTTTDTTTTTSTTTTDTTTTTSTTTTTDTTFTTTSSTTTTDTTTTTTTSSTTTTDTTTTTTDTTTTTATATPTDTIPYSGYCGNGRIGNGTCEAPHDCCTSDGWCDQGYDACGTVHEEEEYIEDPEETYADDEGPCDQGYRGSGVCDDPLLECSVWGWCVPRKLTPTATPVPTFVEYTSTATPSDTPNSNTGSASSPAAIAVGVGAVAVTCGALAAAFVYRLSRKRRSVVSTNTDLSGSTAAFINNNPLYEGSSAVKTNPLYDDMARSTDAFI